MVRESLTLSVGNSISGLSVVEEACGYLRVIHGYKSLVSIIHGYDIFWRIVFRTVSVIKFENGSSNGEPLRTP